MRPSSLSKIRLVITDIDGVWTDGSLIYGPNGEEIKRFHARDGLGVRLLQKADIQVAVASGRDCAALQRRMRDLDIRLYINGNMDKAAACRKLMEQAGVLPEETAFIGDDIPDTAAYACCGIGIAVADAPEYVRAQADLVLKTTGGHGAFRELADSILRAQGRDDLFEPSAASHFKVMTGAQ